MKDIDLTADHKKCDHEHKVAIRSNGVAIGSNPNQPKTDKEIEIVIEALRLINVGNIADAENAISKTRFNDRQREFLSIELKTVLTFVETQY